MKVVAKPDVTELIRSRGGSLYVWTDAHTCCGGRMTYLLTGSRPAAGRRFCRYDAEGFDLWLALGGMAPPDELHLDVKGWRKRRVEAYWNGCAFAL